MKLFWNMFWNTLKNKIIQFSHSLNFKFLLRYVAVVLFCLIIFTSFTYYYSNKALKQMAQQNVNQMILSSGELLNTLIEDIEYEFFTLQSDKTIQKILDNPTSENHYQDIKTLEGILENIDPFQLKILSVELYVPNSDYPSLSEGTSVFSSQELTNDTWYQSVKSSNGKICWHIFDSLDKTYIVSAKELINTTTKEPIAILRLIIDIDYFDNILKDIKLADTGRLFLTTDTHIINPSSEFVNNNLANHELLFQKMLKQTSAKEYAEIDNELYFLSSYALQNTGLYLVGYVRIKEFENSSNNLQFIYLYAMLLTLILLPTMLYVISSTITKLITNLADKMRNYVFESNIDIPRGSCDEIHSLYASYNTMQSTIKNLINDVTTSAKMLKRAELKTLKTQLTPHFLYNALNSIIIMADKYHADDIVQTVTSLSNFFKYSLNNGNEITTIENELRQVKSYVDIQKIRFNNLFEINFDIADDVLCEKICNLSIQPLVENCIVHGFGQTDDYNGIINIRAYKENEDIYIKVEDNGWGINIISLNKLNQYVKKPFDPDEPIEKYGVYNINQRIKLYFGSQYGLSYSQNDMGGLTATIHLSTTLLES